MIVMLGPIVDSAISIMHLLPLQMARSSVITVKSQNDSPRGTTNG